MQLSAWQGQQGRRPGTQPSPQPPSQASQPGIPGSPPAHVEQLACTTPLSAVPVRVLGGDKGLASRVSLFGAAAAGFAVWARADPANPVVAMKIAPAVHHSRRRALMKKDFSDIPML